jgi:hypothetical protein
MTAYEVIYKVCVGSFHLVSFGKVLQPYTIGMFAYGAAKATTGHPWFHKRRDSCRKEASILPEVKGV